MAEHEKGKKFLKGVIEGKEGDPRPIFNQRTGGFNMPEPTPPTVNMPEIKPGMEDLAEEDRFKKMQMLNGNTFENGERSQGDQEAEQRMVQNKKTGLLQKFVNAVTSPFSSALEKEFGTEDQPKFGGKDGVMYNGQFVHPDFYKLIMNRPDLKERFDRTGSIYGE